MCYPWHFIDGACDVTVPRLRRVGFDDACEHLLWAGDGRIGADPIAKLHLTNLKLRLKANAQAGFVVSQQISLANPTMGELVQALKDGDESIPRKILSVGANVLNTS
eukprot:1799888-Prymnesium_polylepis.1